MRRIPLVLVIPCAGCLLFADPPTFTDVPERGWVDIVLQSWGACALHEDDSLWCRDFEGFERVDSQSYVALGNGDTDACAVRFDGLLVCGLGGSSDFTLTGPFVAVAGDASGGCALYQDGGAQCWPDGGHVNGSFTAIGAGDRFACGIQGTTEALQCWDNNATFSAGDEAVGIPNGRFRLVAIRDQVGCGLRPSGEIVCWGDAYSGVPGTIHGNYVHLAIGPYGDNACAVREDGGVECWGNDVDDPNHGELRPPPFAFTRVTLGNDLACGVTTDTRLHCWGD